MSDSTRSLDDASADYCVAKARLSVVSGPDKGKKVTAEHTEIAVGTAVANDLVLTDQTVSRHHLAIELREDGARLRDLGSTNGTKFAERRVVDIWIQPGDRFAIGQTVLEFGEPSGLLREELADSGFEDVVGQSRAMRRLFALLPKAAASDSTVLLLGETGCGKSLLARSIHENSSRRDKPLVVVDCGAIPESLIESELFGHQKGAFTGADRDRLGAFRAADGGTLFLEEIGELPLAMQPRLLRALEERIVSPVGGDTDHRVDIRIIAASNRDLRERVNAGHFRADLFYRLNVIRFRVPPLRERREDIAALAAHFYEQLTDGEQAPAHLLAALSARDWPGNVRELRTAVERAIVFGDLVEETAPAAARVDGGFDDSLTFRAAKELAVESWERTYLSELITRHGGNVSAAARAAKMDRNHLRELLLRREIDYKASRSS